MRLLVVRGVGGFATPAKDVPTVSGVRTLTIEFFSLQMRLSVHLSLKATGYLGTSKFIGNGLYAGQWLVVIIGVLLVPGVSVVQWTTPQHEHVYS